MDVSFSHQPREFWTAAGGLSVAICAWALYDISTMLGGSLVGGGEDGVRPGWGLWVSSIGAVAVTAGSYLMVRDPTY